MYNIKPGRGPSLAGGFMCIAVAIFGVFFSIIGSQMPLGGFFSIFGVIFVIGAIGGAIYNFYNAAAKNRFSHFDITHSGDEPDPLTPNITPTVNSVSDTKKASFCPYCGSALKSDYKFCPECGKDI